MSITGRVILLELTITRVLQANRYNQSPDTSIGTTDIQDAPARAPGSPPEK